MQFAALGIHQRALEAQLAHSEMRPFTKAQQAIVCRGFQRAARSSLPPPAALHLERRLRHKLLRWEVSLFPRRRAERALRMLPALSRVVPPRVVAAVLRTLLNGWATHRRFQQHGDCCFGCQAEDSIEHYADCPVVWDFSYRALGILRPTSRQARLANFLMLDITNMASISVEMTCRAVRVAAVYRTYNIVRHTPHLHGAAAAGALWQSLREAVRGHALAARMVDGVWARHAAV